MTDPIKIHNNVMRNTHWSLVFRDFQTMLFSDSVARSHSILFFERSWHNCSMERKGLWLFEERVYPTGRGIHPSTIFLKNTNGCIAQHNVIFKHTKPDQTGFKRESKPISDMHRVSTNLLDVNQAPEWISKSFHSVLAASACEAGFWIYEPILWNL